MCKKMAFLLVLTLLLPAAFVGLAMADGVGVGDVVYMSDEPNTSVTDDMSQPAKWFRRNVLEKPLFFFFGIAGSAPARFSATVPQAVETQMAQGQLNGDNAFLSFIYGLEKGGNGLFCQAFQEAVQTPFSFAVSFGSGFVGDDKYYSIPEVQKPHWLTRKNWSMPWYMHQFQFAANFFGSFASATPALLGGSSAALKGPVELVWPATYMSIGAGTEAATHIVQGAVEGKAYFNPVTAYDQVWMKYKQQYPGNQPIFN